MWYPGMTLELVEESVIKQALQFFRGNKTKTAEALGISIRTIDNKLEKYGIENVKNELALKGSVLESLPQPEKGKKKQ